MSKERTFKVEEFLYINPNEIVKSTLKWLATRQAQKRYAKDPDVLVINKDGSYNLDASILLRDLTSRQNLVDEIFFKTEEDLSYNNGVEHNAYNFWLLDHDGNEPIVTRVDSNEIIDFTTFKGRVTSLTVEVQHIKLENGADYKIRETRTKESITRELVDENDSVVNLDTLKIDEESKNDLEFLLSPVTEWTADFEPFVELKNTSDAKSDKTFVIQELEDLVVTSQKKRDNLLFSGTKVVTDKRSSKDRQKKPNDGVGEAEKAAKMMAASSVVRTPENLVGSSASSIASSPPNLTEYSNEIRTLLNTILKKTGGATDVDSKGTVQQSKGEVMMSQGDEYKVAKWKLNNRQKKIKELYEKIWKIYTVILKQTNAFKDAKSIHVLLAPDEVLSQTEQLANLATAVEKGFINKTVAFARFNNMTIVDAVELQALSFNVGDHVI